MILCYDNLMLSTINTKFLDSYERKLKDEAIPKGLINKLHDPSMNAHDMAGVIEHMATLSSRKQGYYVNSSRNKWFRECVTRDSLGELQGVPGYYEMDSAFVRDMLGSGSFCEIESLRCQGKHFNQFGVGVATSLKEVIDYMYFLPLRVFSISGIDYVVRVEMCEDFELFLRTPHRGAWGREHGDKVLRDPMFLGNPQSESNMVSYWRPESKFSNEVIYSTVGGLSDAPKISPRYVGKSFYEQSKRFMEEHGKFLFFEVLEIRGEIKGELSADEQVSLAEYELKKKTVQQEIVERFMDIPIRMKRRDG